MSDQRGDLLDSYLAPPRTTAPGGDPLDNALQTDRRDRAVATYFAQRAADAERAARANRLARETGLPGDTVERNFDAVSADLRGRQGADIIRGNPNLSGWFSNPRNAAASADDVPALGAVSTLIGPNSLGNAMLGISPEQARLRQSMDDRWFRELRDPSSVPFEERAARIRAQEQGRQEAIQAERPKNTAGSWWRGVGIGILGGFQQARIGAKAFMADALGLDTQVDAAKEEYQRVNDVLAATTPRDMSRFSQSVYGGAISTGLALPALVGTAATGGTGGVVVGLGIAGSQSGLSAYGKYRARGGTANEALLGGTLEGGIEAGTELLPLSALAHGFGRKALGRFAGEFLLKEMGGEQLATLGQDAVDTAIANPDATWGQYWADRPGAALDTAVAVIMQTGAVGGAHRIAQALRPVERDTEHATDAIAGANLLDTVMDTATGSRLRERDPEAFREFVAQHTEGSPIENVYVPVETMRSLMQSDSFDSDAWGWADDLAAQVSQASVTGGDVVLPLAGVAAHLPGTPAWDTIRQDVRLSPGGMSEREAHEFNERYADLMEEQGRAAAAELRADNEARAPERKVYDAVLTQAREAGFNLRTSQAYADLYASRYASRAARLGTDAWQAFQASNVSIQQELPKALAGYRKADNLDVVINALRRDAQAPSDRQRLGPSLAQFLAGSIDDVGGDLASMGANEWHKGKPGQRRFIRRSAADLRASEGQGSMLGGTASSRAGLDEALERAIEAGYFPELQGQRDIVGGVDSATYEDKPDTQILLDALDAEFRGGTPRYAEAQGTRAQETQASMAEAVDDLRRILDEAGLDPATATREEVEAALDRYGMAPEVNTDNRGLNSDKRPRSVETGDRTIRAMTAGRYGAEVDMHYALSEQIDYGGNGNVDAGHVVTRRFVDHNGVARLEVLTKKGEWFPFNIARDAQVDANRPQTFATSEEAGVAMEGRIAADSVLKPAAQGGRSFDQGERGRIDIMADGRNIIRLFEGRDLSTLLHESGHLWLEELQADAERARSVTLYHGSPRTDMAQADIKVLGRTGQKQGKAGRSYGGFYAADAASIADAQGYAGEGGTVYRIDLVPGAVIEEKEGDITRLSESAIAEYRSRGVDVVKGKDPRGRTEYAIINEAAVRRFGDNAALTDEMPQLVQDWEKVKAWFAANGAAVEDGKEIPTEAHEMWARGMERYFMEGKAPTAGLKGAFQSFRAWLLRIYQVVQRLNTPLTDEVRDVMARLVATDDAIAAAAQDTEAQPLSQEGLGMTDAEYAAHLQLATQARTEAFDALLYRTMDVIRRARTAEWKAERANVREEVAKSVGNRPEFRALAILRAKDDTRVALDRTAIVEEYGEDALAMIPKGVPPTVAAIGGVHPDILAEQVGLRDGRELLDRLMGIGQRDAILRNLQSERTAARKAGVEVGPAIPRNSFEEIVDAQADEIMRERHGDVLTDGSIEEEALGVIHNDTRATVIASELRALARRVQRDGGGERVVTPWQAARDWARRTVREGLIAEQATGAAIARHQRNEAKAGREAERAILDGNADAAFTAKRQQMLNAALFRAAKDAKDEVERIVKRLGKLANARTLPSMDQEYLERIHDLLEAYDMKPRSAREITERESFAAWVKAKEEAGEEVHVPLRLRDAGATNFSKLTVDDLMALDDAVASIAHLGRVKKKLRVAKEERDFEEVVEEFVQGAEALPEVAFSADRNRKQSWARRFDAVMVKMEFLADDLDGGRSDGIANRLLIQGATEAANTKARLTDSVLAPLARLYLDMPKAQQQRLAQRVTVPEFVEIVPDTREIVPGNYTRMDLIAVALNTGNESNYDKMVRGESLPFRQMPDLQWTREKVEAVLARELRAEDWRFVESVWRQIDTLWPEIERSEREITGVVPERVEARTVKTPFGDIRGGYYPVVYDPARSQRAADNYEDDAARLMGQMGRAVSTPKGHTIERTEYAAPLKLAVEPVLLNHVGRVTTRIAYGAWLRDALKFTSHPRVRSLIERKLGPEYYAQIRPWLKSQVNEASMDTATLTALDQVLRQFRVNTTMVGLGFRVTTMLAQLGGLPNSASEVGGKWLAQGMAETAANMGKARGFVFERSEEMQRRAQDFDRDISTAFKEMGTELPDSTAGRMFAPLKRARDKITPLAFWGIGAVDVNLIAVPTWLGAYRRALEEGATEEQAAARGDKAVRKSQGAGRSKDLAAIQNASEGYRVLTMFYSAFSVLYNRQRAAIRDAKAGDYRKAAMETWWVMVAAPLASALLTGDWPQDEEDWLAWASRKVFFGLWAGVPGIRDLASILDRKVSGQYAMPTSAPVYRAFQGLVTVGEDMVRAVKGDRVSDRWLKHAIETPGYFLGLPTGQLSSSIDYGYAVARGEQKPEGPVDVAAGIAKGRREGQE